MLFLARDSPMDSTPFSRSPLQPTFLTEDPDAPDLDPGPLPLTPRVMSRANFFSKDLLLFYF